MVSVMGCVSIVKSDSRFEGVRKALSLISDDLRAKIDGYRKLLIKPNFVSVRRPLSATPVESVDALLSFLVENYSFAEILIAESPAIGSLSEGLRNYGYYNLKKKYPVEFFSFDEDEFVNFEVYDSGGRYFNVRVAKTVLRDDVFKVSICRPKTHDTVVVTLTIKNVAMGVLPKKDKPLMHQGYYYINMNIAKVAEKVLPDLGVIDGLVGMQGNGPVGGDPMRWGVFLSSTNPVELDALTAYAMGFNPFDVGYLYFLNKWGYGEIDPEKITSVGLDVSGIRVKFKPHATVNSQYTWKMGLASIH